jgi:hypothetical protein
MVGAPTPHQPEPTAPTHTNLTSLSSGYSRSRTARSVPWKTIGDLWTVPSVPFGVEQSIFAKIAEFRNLSVSSWLYVYIYFSVPSVPSVPGIQISYNELTNLTSLSSGEVRKSGGTLGTVGTVDLGSRPWKTIADFWGLWGLLGLLGPRWHFVSPYILPGSLWGLWGLWGEVIAVYSCDVDAHMHAKSVGGTTVSCRLNAAVE